MPSAARPRLLNTVDLNMPEVLHIYTQCVYCEEDTILKRIVYVAKGINQYFARICSQQSNMHNVSENI